MISKLKITAINIYMKIIVVYFAYLLPKFWEPIVVEQLQALNDCGLYDECDEVLMSVISDDTELGKLNIFLKDQYAKIKITNIYSKNVFEYPGIKTVYESSIGLTDSDNTIILYFHSKGMNSGITNERNHHTRLLMHKYTIENYKEYVNEFSENKDLDVGAPIPHTSGFSYFNFFWARASYIKNNCIKPEIDDCRYIWETWLRGENDKEVITYSPILKEKKVANPTEVWQIHDSLLL